MADRPILFSGPMVRALVSKRKTQTRRMIKRVPMFSADHDRHWSPHVLPPGGCLPNEWSWWEGPPHGPSCYFTMKLPYAEGDRLWVRETFSNRRPEAQDRDLVWYMADSPWRWEDRVDWKPSIHMPRWASRLTLFVADIRVQRLADISEEDAFAEGVCVFTEGLDRGAPWGDIAPADRALMVRNTYGSAVNGYRQLWETINGADSWDQNPWVVALTFEVQRGNIDDALEKAA